jgi:hypothetical protein
MTSTTTEDTEETEGRGGEERDGTAEDAEDAEGRGRVRGGEGKSTTRTNMEERRKGRVTEEERGLKPDDVLVGVGGARFPGCGMLCAL